MIRGLCTKLCAPKVMGVPTLGILKHLGVLGQNDIWVLVPWLGIEYIIRGKVVASPKSKLWWILWVHVCPRFIQAPKALKLCTNQLIVWFVQVRVSNWCLLFFLVLIPKLQHAFLPPKCYELRNVPQLPTLPLSSPRIHIWVYQWAWEGINNTLNVLLVFDLRKNFLHMGKIDMCCTFPANFRF